MLPYVIYITLYFARVYTYIYIHAILYVFPRVNSFRFQYQPRFD